MHNLYFPGHNDGKIDEMRVSIMTRNHRQKPEQKRIDRGKEQRGMKAEKAPGYGSKKLEGPNRPST